MKLQKLPVALFYFITALLFMTVWLSAQFWPATRKAEPSAYESMEQFFLQHKLRLVPTPEPARDDVVVVSFGAGSPRLLGPYPWSRDVFADLIVKLRALGARVIVMDMLFADPQLKYLSPAAYQSLYPDLPLRTMRIVNRFNYVGELKLRLKQAHADLQRQVAQGKQPADRLERFREQRRALLAMSRRIAMGDGALPFENVVAARRDLVFPTDYFTTYNLQLPGSSKRAIQLFAKHAVDVQGTGSGTSRIKTFEHVVTLYPKLLATGTLVGFNGMEIAQRPFASRANVLLRFRGAVFANQTSVAVARYLDQPIKVKAAGGALSISVGHKQLALDGDGTFPIRYYNDASFPRVVSALSVVREKVAPAAVKGKIVIVDVRIRDTSEFLLVPTPIFGKRWISEVKATVASNILKGHRGPTVHRPGWVQWLEGGTILLFALIFFLLAYRISLVYSLLTGVGLIVALAVADYFIFLPAGIWLSSGILVIEIPLMMVANVGAHYIIQRREKQSVRRAFGFYLPKAVVDHMLKNESALRLGGERRRLSMLFSDIRGFTTISERADPAGLGEALNVHLTTLTRVIFDQRGTLDKYMGDCIMAFFGAPIPNPQHAQDAVQAGLEMQRKLDQIQHVWKRHCGVEVRVGLGVATGEVIVGNMGSERLFDYTVIGDAVNLASRLEGLTKEYGVKVLVSEETRNEVTRGVVFMEVDVVKVKGKKDPVRIFEALDEAEVDDRRRSYIKACEEGIAAFRGQRWDAAREHFDEATQQRPGARLAALYLERIELLRQTSLPDDWDGVTEFTHK